MLFIRYSPSEVTSDAKIAWIRSLDKRFCPDRRLWSRRLLKLGGSGRETAVFWLGSDVLQRSGQTCPAAFVQFRSGSQSCA
jgi:hypothetical protein